MQVANQGMAPQAKHTGGSAIQVGNTNMTGKAAPPVALGEGELGAREVA